MSSLADSFLEDLDELSGESSNEEEESKEEQVDDDEDATHDLSVAHQRRTERQQQNEAEEEPTSTTDDPSRPKPLDSLLEEAKAINQCGIESIAHLKRSRKYLDHIQTIEQHLVNGAQVFSPDQVAVGTEQYNLVVTSNDLMVQIDDEIEAIHRFIADLYASKFSELDSLVPNALDYARVVKTIANEIDLTLVDLSSLLPSATVMSVSVTGSTTSGKPLAEDQLAKCLDACDELLALDQDKCTILRFVESRMKFLAPNVSQLLGTHIAAQLIGLVGGVVHLARIPSCNIQVLGQQKKVLSGFSSASALRHTGIIFQCDLIQNIPQYLRMKATRAVAAKVALCARVDSQPNNRDFEGLTGRRLRSELVEKMEKWQEPQKAKTKKALPIPDEKPRRKRGGKRYRKMKERLQLTDARKEFNRQTFGTVDEEYGDNAMGLTSGRLGQEGSGNLRVIRKEQKQMAKKLKTASFASSSARSSATPAISGLSSSLAFTPVQGIELMNPSLAEERVRQANRSWFSADSGFVSVVKKE